VFEEKTGTALPEGEELLHIFNNSEEKLCQGEGENPCGHYNGLAAAKYAIKWNLAGQDDSEAQENKNPLYQYKGGDGGDCPNFVSQALHAGGMKFMRTNGNNTVDVEASGENRGSEYEHGPGSWWASYYEYPYGGTQILAVHRDFTAAWARGEKLYEHLLEYGLAEDYTGTSQKIRIGDILFYNETGLDNEHIAHSQIVTGLGRRNGRNLIYVSQHSDNYTQPLAYVVKRLNSKGHLLGQDWQIFFLHPTHTAANIG
jgi:hypothetical protein